MQVYMKGIFFNTNTMITNVEQDCFCNLMRQLGPRLSGYHSGLDVMELDLTIVWQLQCPNWQALPHPYAERSLSGYQSQLYAILCPKQCIATP